MLRKVAILLAALGAASGSALAADLPAKVSAPAPLYNWTGWYAGVSAGYQAGTVTGSGVAGLNLQPRLWMVGLNGGYRIQVSGNIVLGLDINLPVWASSNSSNPATFGSLSMQPTFILAPEAQLGYAIGRWLPFVGLGVGVTEIKGSITPLGKGTSSDTVLDPLFIFTFGLDYAWSDHVIVGLRYDHIELDTTNWTFAGIPPQQAGGFSDGATAVLQYKF
jgi:outer membrane immunogenic protein